MLGAGSGILDAVPAGTGTPGGASIVTRRIKVGVAGAGVFGGHHASKYAQNAHVDLAGVHDLDPQRAAALAEKLQVCAFSKFDDLLDACDAMVIAVPASHHFDLARRSLAAGRHVFVEKPITLRLDEADALIALAAEMNLTLQVGHQERYVFAAAGLLERGRSPLKIDSIRCAMGNGRCEDVSVVLDLMVHDIDLIRQLTKADIETVTGDGDEHDATAGLMLSNGVVVSLKANRRTSVPERRMTLVYDDGVVEFDFLRREVSNSTPAALRADFSSEASPLAFSDPLAFGANEFIINILENRDPTVGGRDGREALRWARRIEDAAGITGDLSVREPLERRRA